VAPLGTGTRVALASHVADPSGPTSSSEFGRASPPPSSPHGALRVRSSALVSHESSSMWKLMSSPRPPRWRPGPQESCASSTRSSSHGLLASHTSVEVKRVAASETCIRLEPPSPRAWPPWPIGCGEPSVQGSPVASRSPHHTSAQMSPPLQAGTASGIACATAW
jgi:hypothetical protein